MIAHPHLAELQKLYQSETQPFRKVHRMIDLFESIIKTHTAVIISEYVQHNNLSDTAKGLLSQGLRTPSLGTWQLFSRVLIQELEKDAISWKLPSFVGEFHDLDAALNKEKTNVIAFRNGYAHGATPTDEQCELDINKFDPFLTKLLNFQWLLDSRTIVEDDRVYLSSSDQLLSLHPILLYRDEKEAPSIAFFNDIKNDKVGLLNYPLGKHYREKNFLSEFHQYIPIDEWKKTRNNEFEQRVEQLTETFKGRTSERANLLEFVSTQTKGYLSIQGNPGIGKSALIAQFFKDLKGEKNLQNVLIVEYFIRRGTPQAQSEFLINYLNKRTDDVFPQGKEIRAEGKMIFELQNQLFSKWRLWDQHANGRKLVFLIDGLDEGVENDILTYLPREVFENILFIYGSRPGGHKSIDDLWASLPVENHTKLELSSLGKDDIRAMIYDVANKYELERESPWIDAVQKRSQGNPLYLKLLCNSIENREIELNDIQRLPSTIDDYYKAIVLRYANNPDGDDLLNSLFTFAAAKDYLTFDHLKLINQLGTASIVRIGAILKEVLYENPLTEEILDYQLFHESFREYLINIHSREINDATQRIIGFCETWNEHQGTWEQRYALEHYSDHLYQCGTERHNETLLRLMHDNAYTNAQKSVLRSFNSTNKLMRLCLLKSSEIKDFDKQLEAALSLVDLKYEEANSTHEIIDMIAAGEIELALNRIESFGGTDEVGLRSKFILYMLCLMELTLLDSKDKPFQKSAIERVLFHLDEQLPIDHSILNWSEFFPTHIVFQMARIWINLDLEYLIVYRRTAEKVLISELTSIANELFKHGQADGAVLLVRQSLDCANEIEYKYDKAQSLCEIATAFYKIGKEKEGDAAINNAIMIATNINDDQFKSITLAMIATQISKQGQFNEAISMAQDISDEIHKCEAFANISTELSKKGQFNEAISIAQEIPEEIYKCEALANISTELSIRGLNKEATKIMRQAINSAQLITKSADDAHNHGRPILHSHSTSQINKSSAYYKITREFFAQGLIDEAISYSENIHHLTWLRSQILSSISTYLFKQGHLDKSASVMQQAINIANETVDEYDKSDALALISSELHKQGKFNESKSTIEQALAVDKDNIRSLSNIATQLFMQGQTTEATSTIKRALTLIFNNLYETNWRDATIYIAIEFCKIERYQEALTITNAIFGNYEINQAITDIAIELSKQGLITQSLAIAEKIDDSSQLDEAMTNIVFEISKLGYLQEAISIANNIEYDYYISLALANIATQLFIRDFINEAEAINKHALKSAQNIEDECEKCMALTNIVKELSKQGKEKETVTILDEALKCVENIDFEDYYRNDALDNIALKLCKRGQLEQALSITQLIDDEHKKSEVQVNIATELSKQGKIKKARSIIHDIDDAINKNRALVNIATVQFKKGNLEESAVLMQEAVSRANDFCDDYYKCVSLSHITSEFLKQGNWEFAEEIGMKISRIKQRNECWRQCASEMVEIQGWQKSLESQVLLGSAESKIYYLKGWVEKVNLADVNEYCLSYALPILSEDPNSIEILLRKYAVQATATNKISYDILTRFNQSLKIDWLLTISDQFAKATNSTSRNFDNLEDWLNDIEDEDDRDQIELWAKQVTKGKITESEFSEKLNTLNLY